jgi:hypothetical protein
MTFPQKLMILALLAGVIAMVALTARPASAAPAGRGTNVSHTTVAAWLWVVALALIVVGIVSGTLIRHIIQIAPFVVALSVLPRRPAWGVSAAATLLAFWFLVMGAIWLFLLGVARIFTGTFTTAEIALTVVIGVGSVLGLVAARRTGTSAPIGAQLGVVAAFAILQLAAMFLSMQPFVARR